MNTDIAMEKFLKSLKEKLRPLYVPPRVIGGHDFTHCERMVSIGEKIDFLEFNRHEFEAVAWLHNLDRYLETERGREITQEELEKSVLSFLRESPFGKEAVERILDAIREHPKKYDEPNDSTLLQALRIADKVDRLNLHGVWVVASHAGSILPPYDMENPFGFSSTPYRGLTTLLAAYIYVLEFYALLPSDAARALVDEASFKRYIDFVRDFGALVARETRRRDEIEDKIAQALETHYPKFAQK